MCISDLSPGDVPLVDESWFLDECIQLIPESPGHDVEDALQQGLQGVCAPRSPSDSPTKASLSAHGDSPRMSPGSPLTLASVRPAQSHVESVVPPARGSLAPDEVCRYSGSDCEPMDGKRAVFVQPVNDGIVEVQVFPPDAPTVLHIPAVECVLAVNTASRVFVDDMFTAASQSHLDTEPESISAILRNDYFAEAGLGAQSSQAPEDVSGGLPAIGTSPVGGQRQKQPKREPRSHKQTLKQKAHKK